MKILHKLSRKHYVQCCLAIFLTAAALLITRPIWLEKMIIVAFNSSANNPVQYQVFYTTQDKEGFQESKSVKKMISAGSQEVVFKLPIKKIKKFRLDFDIGINPRKTIISDLRIKGKKSIRPDYRQFYKHDIEEYVTENNGVRISSNQKDPFIVWPNNLNLSGKIRIDWCLFIIVSVLSFLFFRKTVQYLCEFKIEQHHSRIDILTILLFFAMLFVPMLHISDAEISKKENRMLAKFPQLKVAFNGGGNYGGQFNSWYSDRFLGRNLLISLYKQVTESLNASRGDDKVLIGKNGWMFYKLDNSINNFTNTVVLPAEKLENGLKYLVDINDWCKKHNKKFYYIIAPDKNKVYGENYRFIKMVEPVSQGIGYQFINYIHQHSDIKAVYLLDELMQHKDEGLLYYKNDTHWNDLGAYYGYKKLMQLMEIKPRAVSFKQNDTHEPGDLTNMYKQIEPPVLYARADFTNAAKCSDRSKEREILECVNNEKSGRVFVLRDSFTVALVPYLSSTFAKITFFWRYNLTADDLSWIDKNADIIILENVERHIPSILDMKFPQNI